MAKKDTSGEHTKRCSRCKKWKRIGLFYKEDRSYCRACARKWQREYRQRKTTEENMGQMDDKAKKRLRKSDAKADAKLLAEKHKLIETYGQPIDDEAQIVIRDDAKTKACNSLYYLCKEILSYEDMEEQPHKIMCDFIDNDKPRKLMVGSRGIYKTSIGTIGRAIQLLLRNPNERILVVQNNQYNAQATVRKIKTMFDQNQRLRAISGDMLPRSGDRSPWSQKALQMRRACIETEPSVVAASVDQDLASQHYTRILGDDVVSGAKKNIREDDIIILRPEDVAMAIGWYKLTMEGLSIRKKGFQTQIQFIVNRWGVEDFARYIMDHHLITADNPGGFEFLEMAVVSDDGVLLWPTYMDENYLEDIHRRVGDFIYYTQYECRPYNPDNRGFPVELNSYWEGKYPPGYEECPQDFRIYGLMDLADANKPASCNTSAVILWVDSNNHIWVGEAIRGRMDTNKKIEVIHHLVLKYGLDRFHIEENLHRGTLEYVLYEAMKKAGIRYRVMPLKPKQRNKDARIMRLQPHHKHRALHFKKDQRHLLQELRDYGYSHWKDIIDALGYIMDFIRGPIKNIEEQKVVRPDNIIYPDDIKRAITQGRENRWGGGGLYSKQNPERFQVQQEQFQAPA